MANSQDINERLAQPEQEPVDSAEKAGAYMDARLWEFIDMAAAWPEAKPDPRTWSHVMVYAPKPAQEPVKFNCTVVDDAHPEGVPLSQWGKQQKQKPFCYHDGRNIVGKEYAHHCDVFPLYTEPQPEQKTCLVANESCKHGSWCSEVYCQEHCKFVEQPEQEPVACQYAKDVAMPEYRCAGKCQYAQPEQEPIAWKDKTYEQLKEKNHD